jgi:hypothetical protein
MTRAQTRRSGPACPADRPGSVLIIELIVALSALITAITGLVVAVLQ